MRGEDQRDNEQRCRTGHESQSRRGEQSPAPPSVITMRLAGPHTRQKSGIALERALPLDQPSRYISRYRLHDVGNVVRLGQYVASHPAVVQETVNAFIAPHRDMRHRIDPQSRRLAAANAAIE